MTFGAIAPGTDLSQHARELVRIHDAFLDGGRPPSRPRALVARSWARVLSMGLDPDSDNARTHATAAELARTRATSPLAQAIEPLRTVLTGVADASQFVMVVCNADGLILWREGSARVRQVADRLGFAEGAYWSERNVGSNAIGTALAEAAPVQLFSAEHFEHSQHPWYCTAAPIHDPRSGELLGVVDVSGPALTLHPALTALVESAVRVAELELWRHHEARLERLRRASEPVVGTVGGPALVVDAHGWVAHHTGVAVRDRIAVPQPERTLVVPGMGLCLPERLGEGWLVRPAGDERAVHARLDLTAERPLLEVSSDRQPWRVPLSPRHADILRALVGAGPGGVSVRELSTALYGDEEHLVTARAEVSRLRRVIGALVTTNPYRLAEGVRLSVVGPGTP